MSHQLTFAESDFNGKCSKTCKEIFLARMDALLPWAMVLEVIKPIYPKAGNGRRPDPLDTVLRIHCMLQWYSLSAGSMEEALYEIAFYSTGTVHTDWHFDGNSLLEIIIVDCLHRYSIARLLAYIRPRCS